MVQEILLYFELKGEQAEQTFLDLKEGGFWQKAIFP